MTSLPSYLPIDRRLALGANATLPDRVHGVALFADISGFTPLTAALYRELGSRRGAEALIAQLNRVFTALVTEVHNHGGAAINFSGDSITCWFDNETGERPAAERALACAVALQRAMTGIATVTTPGGTLIQLGLKVSAALGPARRFLVGDPASYVLEVLAGPTLDRMAAAEDLARRGDIVVSAELLAALDPPPPVSEWRHDAHGAFAVLTPDAAGRDAIAGSGRWPVAAALADEVARPWLLPPVYNHLRYAPEAFLAELRTATTLFVRFSGIDYDDDDAGTKLDSYVCQIQDVLNRFEGFLLQITMGDKGGYLHASFGAPVAHEDDVERAAAAALEIARLSEAITYLERPQIGISSGLVHSGAYGSPERRTYGVVGNEVNVSARLMTAAAPGQILLSASVAEQLAGAFTTEALPPMALKGLRQPVDVWALQGRQQTTLPLARSEPDRQLVGRAAERAAIADLVAGVAAGQSGILVIEGEAGIGKSLLVSDLVGQAAGFGATGDGPALRVFSGYGDAVEQSTPYHAWRPIFEQLFGLAGRDSGSPPAAWPEAVVETIEPDLRHLAPLLNAVLPLELPETPLTEQISGEARQDAIHQLLVSAMRPIAAATPLILILDDAHWLDSVSWTLVRRVQRDIEPLLLVLVVRPMGDERPATFEALCQLPIVQPIRLDTLERAAIEELVCRRLGVAALPPQVARLIHDKAEGHPFFSEELAYALRDSGLLETAGGQVRLLADPDDLQALDFPNSIEGVITSRIDALLPAEQLTVKVASVIGRIFAFRTLQGIHPAQGDPDALRGNLDHLARLDITPLETPEPELTHFFRQIVTQEVVYELMTSDQKRRLHREAAQWYEGADAADLVRTVPLIAHHYHMAGDLGQAAIYYGQAGENAFRDFANEEAVRFLELALTMCDADTPVLQRAHWHNLCAEASYRLTRMAQSQEHYRAALDLLGYDLPETAAGRGLRLAGQLLRQVAHRRMPGRFVGRASAEDRAVMLEAARVYEGLSEVVYNEGDQLTAFLGIMSTLNLSEQAGPSPELIRSYANMATTTAIVSRSIADGYRARALTLDAGSDDLAARAAIQIPLSVDSTWMGAWDRAEAEIDIALDIHSRLGEWRRWGVVAWILPQVAQARGQLVRGRDLWAELHSVTLRSEDTRHQVRCRGGQFFNFLMLDLPDDALAAAAEVDDLLARNPEMVPVEERMWHGVRARRALLAGDPTGAHAESLSQLAAIGRASLKFDLLDVFAGPAEVLLTLWEQGVATPDEAKQGCKVISSYARNYPFGRPRADWLNGRYAWLAGKPQEAEKLWARGLERATALAMPYERALILAEMGRALEQADYLAEGETLLAQCRSETGPV